MEYRNFDEPVRGPLVVDEETRRIYSEMAGWMKFLAIIGFIGVAIVLLMGMAIGAAMSSKISSYSQVGWLGKVGGTGIMLLYFIFAALYVYPNYALYRSSSQMSKAIQSLHQESFTDAVAWMKRMFKFKGVLYIIGIGSYVLMIIFGMLLGSMR